MYPYVHCSIIYNKEMWKQPKCPLTEDWIKMTWHLHTMEYSSTMKKNEILPFATTSVDLEDVRLSEVNQTQKDKYDYFTYMWNLKNKINKQNETDSWIGNKTMVATWKEG